MKLAFVIHRYGKEIVGGAELHCKWVVEELSKEYDVTVLTTTAQDYLTWYNDYPPGEELVDGIPVIRFKVEKQRVFENYERIANKVCFFRHTDKEEYIWLEEHGPYCPSLIDFIKKNKNKYDIFVFFSYRYWNSFYGLPIVKDKAILVPTAEHDRVIYLRIFKKFFNLPTAIAYNSYEERDLINKVSENYNVKNEIVGVGIKIQTGSQFENISKIKKKLDILGDYVLYIGRIEREKGVLELLNYFNRFINEKNERLTLLLVGQNRLNIKENPYIHLAGIVTDTEKMALLENAKLLIMPSRYESLSMVLLEAWSKKKPVLVNGHCEVLRGQVIRSNGGLYYKNYEEFREALELLIHNQKINKILGQQGYNYYITNYTWDVITKKYKKLFNYILRKEK